MLKPAAPPNETERLAALRRLQLLDTPPEERFDRVTRLAVRLFDAPIAMINLIDADRQWAKSVQGPAPREAPRETSFCAHAILGDAPFVIPDARRDGRFSDNPWVTGDPFIRFYAAYPLAVSPGLRVGTHCIMDNRPRRLRPADLAALRDLASLAERELTGAPRVSRERADRRASEEESRFKTQYLSHLSFDLRSPLNAIVGYTYLLLTETYGALSESQRLPLERIRENTDDLLDLAKDISNLVGLESTPVPDQIGETHLSFLIEDLLAETRPFFDEKSIEVQYQAGDPLPGVESDSERIKESLSALLLNAIQFTERKITITTRDRPERRGIEIIIQGAGVDIPEEALSQIFDLAPPTEAGVCKKGRSVLGLAIAKKWITLLKGEVRAGRRGEGCAFTIFLPYRPTRADAA